MKAVVVAAGEGSRMRMTAGKEPFPKPLLPLLGLRIIERVFLAARKAGIKEFVVVIGYRGDEIRRYLGDGSKWDLKIQYAFNEHWLKGNGYSLLAAKPYLESENRFLLLMADHIFEPNLLKQFLQFTDDEIKKVQSDKNLHFLAVDACPEKVTDLEEATKVYTRAGKIIALGKEIKDFNGVDCGIFNFGAGIFETVEKSLKDSGGSLSEALQLIVKTGNLRPFEFKDYYWHDIDQKKDLQQARQKLLQHLLPKKDGIVSRYFNRPISLTITSVLANLSATPNIISFFSFSLCLLGGVLFALGYPLAGGLLAQLASIIDGVDGEIARLKFQESLFGAYLDSILDRYGDAALIGGLTAGSLLGGASSPSFVLIMGFLALTASPLSMLAKEKYANLTGKTYNPLELDGYLRYFPFNRDGRLALIMLGGVFNQLTATLLLLALLTNLQAIYRLFVARQNLG